MFIYSLRAKTLKFFGLICLCLVVVIVGITFVPSYVKASAEPVGEINYSKIKTEQDRINFLKQFGWETTGEAVDSEEVTIPAQFDKIFGGYNEIQKRQGLDLSKYKGKEMMRYTYEIKNYPNYDGKVMANLLVYRGKVVGGDICSADVKGFIHGFEGPQVSE
jgi:hypothetical protein